MATRPTPFELVFGSGAEERFTTLRRGIEGAARDPHDRDAFLLVREVAELLHELHPEGAGSGAIQALVAFVHRAYLYWMDGEQVRTVDGDELTVLLSDGRSATQADGGLKDRLTVHPTAYLRLPPLRVWGTALADRSPEPLDGWFLSRSADRLSLLAIFGLNPARQGFTAVETGGPRPVRLERPDGSPLFSPLLSGAAAAGLASVVGEEELLELAWRVEGR